MQEILQNLLCVALGSVFGGSARYFLSGLIGRSVGETFPWGTLTVNVTGCFAIGVLAATAGGQALTYMQVWWQLAVVGFLGTYTTVSSFSLQTLALARDGDWPRAAGNILLSLTLCLAAVALGLGIAVILSGAP